MKEDLQLTEERWQAIVHNDTSYDDKFIYAIQSTGIFCRPSCKSRIPKRENVRIFHTAEQALSATFRPCKRCKPTGEHLPDQDWVAQITQYIDTNYSDILTLDILADMCHGSPYHLHRTFKRVKGITPAEYILHTRMKKAMEYLVHSDTAIADIGLSVGIPNTSYFVTLFKKVSGYTPTEYRQLNRNNKATEVSHHDHKS